MLNLKRVAITGGISSGKSTVISIFQKLGAYVVSADQIAHQFLSSSTALSKQVILLLGDEVLSSGRIDRKRVAKIVFQNPAKLKQLEALIHPYVAEEIERHWKEAMKSQKYPLFAAEVPLLFEAGLDPWYDAIIAVLAPHDLCKKRFCEQSDGGEEEFERRAELQQSPAEKAKKANFIIENMGSLEELQAKATSLYTLLSNGEKA